MNVDFASAPRGLFGELVGSGLLRSVKVTRKMFESPLLGLFLARHGEIQSETDSESPVVALFPFAIFEHSVVAFLFRILVQSFAELCNAGVLCVQIRLYLKRNVSMFPMTNHDQAIA